MKNYLASAILFVPIFALAEGSKITDDAYVNVHKAFCEDGMSSMFGIVKEDCDKVLEEHKEECTGFALEKSSGKPSDKLQLYIQANMTRCFTTKAIKSKK